MFLDRPLILYDISLIFIVFINIHEYENYIICISNNKVKVQCQRINFY